ncbi:MAG: hypothetical protein KAW17_12450, partial [Candidatus Eisenbacteria sp.]|nr:hypothetical protein [Candidatus Eisenbacteria bacterium]
VSAWTGYNGTEWIDLEGQGLAPARIGVCYDLNDCDLPCGECQNLTGVWFAFSRLSEFGVVDLEIYCANENCCPVGAPLGGFYDYHVAKDQAWKYFPFDGLRLDCVDCKFIVMVTVKTPEHCVPLSDANDLNRLDGCEIEWRCAGHSYCYRSLVDYCDVYGYPGRMLVGYSGACPPDDGFHVEWLSHAYISCGGTTATEKTSWSEIKALYK